VTSQNRTTIERWYNSSTTWDDPPIGRLRVILTAAALMIAACTGSDGSTTTAAPGDSTVPTSTGVPQTSQAPGITEDEAADIARDAAIDDGYDPAGFENRRAAVDDLGDRWRVAFPQVEFTGTLGSSPVVEVSKLDGRVVRLVYTR
jgi:hypothetical protein